MTIYEVTKFYNGGLVEIYGVILPYKRSLDKEVIEKDAIEAVSKFLDIPIREYRNDEDFHRRYIDSEDLTYECTNSYIIPNHWESFIYFKTERAVVKKYYNDCETLYCFDFKKIRYADGVFYFEKGDRGEYLKLDSYSTYVFNL